jgi:hypothetical protein
MFRQFSTRIPTHLTGVWQHSDPLPHLKELYEQTLVSLKGLPSTYYYRGVMENVMKQRLADVGEFGSQLVEERIEEAECELRLIEKMNEWKPWARIE